MSDAPHFRRFLEASKLDNLTAEAFVHRANRWVVADMSSLSIFDQSSPEFDLPPVDDQLQQLFATRRSRRVFNDDPLPIDAVASALAAAGAFEGRSVIPSAGGFDPLGIYALVRRSEGKLDGSVVRYLPGEHRVARLGPVPDDDRCRRLFGLDCEGMPSLLVVIAVDPAATLRRYGERGGRFLVQQVGHAMQNIGLRLAQTQQTSRRRPAGFGRRTPVVPLHGYLTGGLLDEVTTVLGIDHTGAVPLGAYAVGRA